MIGLCIINSAAICWATEDKSFHRIISSSKYHINSQHAFVGTVWPLTGWLSGTVYWLILFRTTTSMRFRKKLLMFSSSQDEQERVNPSTMKHRWLHGSCAYFPWCSSIFIIPSNTDKYLLLFVFLFHWYLEQEKQFLSLIYWPVRKIEKKRKKGNVPNICYFDSFTRWIPEFLSYNISCGQKNTLS